MRFPYLFTLLYILSIPFTSLMVTYSPSLTLPDGTYFTWAVFVVGFVFVLRDFCQREVGTYGALAAIGVAGFITWQLTTPQLAIASLSAFAVAELADWAIYTLTNKPLSTRVLYSSLLAGPLDTAIFLWGANSVMPGILTWSGFIVYGLCKVLVAVGMYYLLGALERRKMLA